MFESDQKIICIGMHQGYSFKLKVGRIYTFARYDNNPVLSNEWLFVKENNEIDCYEIKYFIPYTKCRLTNLIFNIKPKSDVYGF